MADATTSLGLTLGIDTSDPQVASAIASVQQEAAEDGASGLETSQRISTLLHSFNDIYSQGHVDAVAALTAAKKYVTQNHALSGAIDTTVGLVSAVQAATTGNPTPADLVSDFTGPLVAVAVASGAATAGVGAAIVGTVAVVSALLDNAGVFGSPPHGTTICPGYVVDPAPDLIIGCVALWNPHGPVSPGTSGWRHFPEPTAKADSMWFSAGGGQWLDATWGSPSFFGSTSSGGNPFGPKPKPAPVPIGQRMIDHAFPEYARLYSEVNAKGASDFEKAFYTAWKANKQYWINGRHGATNDQVLVQALRIWNRAHEPGAGLDLRQNDHGSYLESLVASAVNAGPGADVLSSDGAGLHLHTGGLKPRRLAAQVPKHVVALHNLGAAGKAVGAATEMPSALSHLAALGHAQSSIWSRAKPWMPLVLGVASFPIVGSFLIPVVGAAGTALWIEAHRKGWKLPKLTLPKL